MSKKSMRPRDPGMEEKVRRMHEKLQPFQEWLQEHEDDHLFWSMPFGLKGPVIRPFPLNDILPFAPDVRARVERVAAAMMRMPKPYFTWDVADDE